MSGMQDLFKVIVLHWIVSVKKLVERKFQMLKVLDRGVHNLYV